MVKNFKQGSIVYMDFDPQLGHEQKGRRPALVVSNDTYNRFCNLFFVCPITSTEKRHPFHIALNSKTKIQGYILCDQLKALDLTKRNADYVEMAPLEIVEEVLDILKSIIE